MIKTNVYFVINYITKKDTDLKLKKKKLWIKGLNEYLLSGVSQVSHTRSWHSV